MLIVAIAVCGTHRPNTTVAPTNGAVSNQILAHTTVEKAHIFFFSLHTNSVVQVVSIANVDDMATLDTMEIAIRIATLLSPVTVFKKDFFFSFFVRHAKSEKIILFGGTHQTAYATAAPSILNSPDQNHLFFE